MAINGKKLKAFIQRKREERAKSKMAEGIIQEKGKEEYWKAKETEALKLARFKAEQERLKKEERFRYRPPQPVQRFESRQQQPQQKKERHPPPPSGLGIGTSGMGFNIPPPNYGIFGTPPLEAQRKKQQKKKEQKKKKKKVIIYV